MNSERKYTKREPRMSDKPTDPQIIPAPIHTFGWQRRADLDNSLGQVWESPDGKLRLFQGSAEPMAVKLKIPSFNDLYKSLPPDTYK